MIKQFKSSFTIFDTFKETEEPGSIIMKFVMTIIDYCGDSTGYNDPQAKELKSGASEWRLLLQVDTDDDAGMMWGDCGRLYFWIRVDDLRRRDFDEVWTILQCF